MAMDTIPRLLIDLGSSELGVVPEELFPYLDLLADNGVLGSTREGVVLTLLRDGLAHRMMGNGLLRGLLNGDLQTKREE